MICLSKILWDVEELKLRRLKHITSEGIQSIASKGLKYLNLRRCDGITDDGLIAVIRNCPNIERLNVCRLHKLTDVSIVCVAETLGSKLVSLARTFLIDHVWRPSYLECHCYTITCLQILIITRLSSLIGLQISQSSISIVPFLSNVGILQLIVRSWLVLLRLCQSPDMVPFTLLHACRNKHMCTVHKMHAF